MRVAPIAVPSVLAAFVALACSAQDKAKDREADKATRGSCACEGGGSDRRELLERAQFLLTKLPSNPFVDVKPGDWWLYTAKALGADKPADHFNVLWTVDEQDGDDVRVTEKVTGGTGSWLEKGRWFNRQDSPTLGSLRPRGLSQKLRVVASSEPRVTEEKRTISGEVFSTKRLSWIEILDEVGPGKDAFFDLHLGPYTTSGSIWVAPDARGSIVALTLAFTGAVDVKVSFELAGYGSAGKADWGRAPDESKK